MPAVFSASSSGMMLMSLSVLRESRALLSGTSLKLTGGIGASSFCSILRSISS